MINKNFQNNNKISHSMTEGEINTIIVTAVNKNDLSKLNFGKIWTVENGNFVEQNM